MWPKKNGSFVSRRTNCSHTSGDLALTRLRDSGALETARSLPVSRRMTRLGRPRPLRPVPTFAAVRGGRRNSGVTAASGLSEPVRIPDRCGGRYGAPGALPIHSAKSVMASSIVIEIVAASGTADTLSASGDPEPRIRARSTPQTPEDGLSWPFCGIHTAARDGVRNGRARLGSLPEPQDHGAAAPARSVYGGSEAGTAQSGKAAQIDLGDSTTRRA